MNKYQIIFRGVSRTINATDATVARRLGTKWLHSCMAVPEDGFSSLNVAVIDIDASGYGKHTGHCQGCSPNEMCSRSGTCGWCDERFASEPGYPTEAERIAAKYILARHEAMHVYHNPDSTAVKKAAAEELLYGKTKRFGFERHTNEEIDAEINTVLLHSETLRPAADFKRNFEAKRATFDNETGTYSDPKCWACPTEPVPTFCEYDGTDGVQVCDRRYCRSNKGRCEFADRTDPKPSESTWARIQQEELDKVHAIWSRRSTDPHGD